MTIFEQILQKKINVSLRYEDNDVIAIDDINPQADLHLLIIPKKKARSMNDLNSWSDEECGRYFKAATKVADALGITNGYRLVINTGHDGGQTVDYLHLHLLAGTIKNDFH